LWWTESDYLFSINIENASDWCNVVQSAFILKLAHKTKTEFSTRTSVTFPSEVYASLEIIAKQKKVSVAWVIRDAAEGYVAEQWPLFSGQNKK
jgi:hypothetical protein